MLLGELEKEGIIIIDCEGDELTFESENNA